MTDPNVTIVSDLRCLHLPRLLENFDSAAEPLPTSDGGSMVLCRITSIERLQNMTIDDIKKEIQMIMWAHYEVDVCRKDFVLLLDTLRTAAKDDSRNQLVKVDHCDSVATVLRQWEMPFGTAAEGVRIRIDPCWKNYVQSRTEKTPLFQEKVYFISSSQFPQGLSFSMVDLPSASGTLVVWCSVVWIPDIPPYKRHCS